MWKILNYTTEKKSEMSTRAKGIEQSSSINKVHALYPIKNDQNIKRKIAQQEKDQSIETSTQAITESRKSIDKILRMAVLNISMIRK